MRPGRRSSAKPDRAACTCPDAGRPRRRASTSRPTTTNDARAANGLPGRPSNTALPSRASPTGLPGFIATPAIPNLPPRRNTAALTWSSRPKDIPPVVMIRSTSSDRARSRSVRTSASSRQRRHWTSRSGAEARRATSIGVLESRIRPEFAASDGRSESSSPVASMATLSGRRHGTVTWPDAAKSATWRASRRVPARARRSPGATSSPRRRTLAPAASGGGKTRSPDLWHCSCIATRSAPKGTGAPVITRSAPPGGRGLMASPARTTPANGAPSASGIPEKANPSTAD